MANVRMSKESKEVLDIHNKVSPTELEKIIKKNMETILENPEMSKDIPPILIRSSPGMGKSTIVKEVAKEMGVGFIDARLAEMESCDIRGLPVPDNETKTMNWYVNGTWPKDKDSAGILFLDELTSCPRDVQVASYELILDRKLGTLYSLPKKWMIVSAGNNTTDRAIATAMSSALSNRFLHFELDANDEDWRLWAQRHDIHPSVIGFISYRPSMLHKMDGENLERGWPSPRAWERVSTMVKLYGDDGHSENPILRKIVYGLVGNGAGVEFMEFYKINQQFANVKELMTNPKADVVIPEKSDGKYALVSAMNYQLWRGKTAEEEALLIDGFYRICNQLSSDFATMAMISAMNGPTKDSKAKCCEKMF